MPRSDQHDGNKHTRTLQRLIIAHGGVNMFHMLPVAGFHKLQPQNSNGFGIFRGNCGMWLDLKVANMSVNILMTLS